MPDTILSDCHSVAISDSAKNYRLLVTFVIQLTSVFDKSHYFQNDPCMQTCVHCL